MPAECSRTLRCRALAGTLAVWLVTAAAIGHGQTAPAALAATVPPSDKGGFQYSEPGPWPELELDLRPIEKQVLAKAATRCGTALSAAPMDLGDSKGVMSKLVGNVAGAAVGKLIGGFLGGGGREKQPDLYKDPVRNKHKEKIEHPSGDARIRIGGQFYEDGLVLSARVDKARGKGTFHTMFLEKPDCTRIWPEQYLGYKLWGEWSLSVSVTETRSRYRNGDLVDRSVSRSGWSRSGDFDFSRGFSLYDEVVDDELKLLLDADDAYLAQLRREVDVPAWREMGFGEPTQGIRDAGGLFRVDPAEITPDTIAVVHITQVDDGRYRTLGFPLRLSAGSDGRVTLSLLEGADEVLAAR